MSRRMCMRTHVALWLLLSLRLALQSDAASPQRLRQQAALVPSPATWHEASERCATLGPSLAPRELPGLAATDGLSFGIAATHQCTPNGSDATVVWMDVGNGSSTAPASLVRPGQCPALVFNHTSRQARPTAEACDQRRCFLCSAPQAGLYTSATSRGKHQRRMMVADSSNCNMAGKITPVA
jgi:hypothetical protein